MSRIADGAVKPIQAATAPANPDLVSPMPIPTWLEVGTGQHLAQRHEVRVPALVHPSPADHERLAEVADVGHRSSERGQSERQEGEEDGACRLPSGRASGREGVLFHSGILVWRAEPCGRPLLKARAPRPPEPTTRKRRSVAGPGKSMGRQRTASPARDPTANLPDTEGRLARGSGSHPAVACKPPQECGLAGYAPRISTRAPAAPRSRAACRRAAAPGCGTRAPGSGEHRNRRRRPRREE